MEGLWPQYRLRLHQLNPVYMIQPVWRPAVSCKQTSNRLSNGFDNRLNVCIRDTAGCQTGYNPGLTTGLTTGCIVYASIYPVVKPVRQQVVSCKRGFTVLFGYRCCCCCCEQHKASAAEVLWCRWVRECAAVLVFADGCRSVQPRLLPAQSGTTSAYVVVLVYSINCLLSLEHTQT